MGTEMSDSRATSGRTPERGGIVPRAVIHKQILDAAESRPEASMEALAEEVTGATTSIVEHVLEEYGDPAVEFDDDGNDDDADDDVDADDTDADDTESDVGAGDADDTGDGVDGCRDESEEQQSATDDAGSADDCTPAEPEIDEAEPGMPDHDSRSTNGALPLEPDELTETQLETLREIADDPTATQAELGDTLGVSGATINQRVNAIDGFDWTARAEFVEHLFENEPTDNGNTERSLTREVTASNESSTHPEPGDQAPDGDLEASSTDDRSSNSGDDSTRSGPEPIIDDLDSDPKAAADNSPADSAPEDGLPDDSLEDLSEQLAGLSQRLESVESRLSHSSSSADGLAAEPELTHKVIHACLTADHISEEEELRILKAIVTERGLEVE